MTDDYFEHLEHLRGQGRKMKALESAREAVRQGTAGEGDIKIAAQGVHAEMEFSEEPESLEESGATSGTRREAEAIEYDKRMPDHRESQDVALYNLNDEAR